MAQAARGSAMSSSQIRQVAKQAQVWADGLGELHERIRPRFGRIEPRRRALDYLQGGCSVRRERTRGRQRRPKTPLVRCSRRVRTWGWLRWLWWRSWSWPTCGCLGGPAHGLETLRAGGSPTPRADWPRRSSDRRRAA